jgi:glutamine amidotransferase
MCRLVAYLGEPEVTLSRLVLEPDHSLLVQSYAPEEMMSGVVNADGFGVGWYAPWSGEEPAVYRSMKPLWSDESFAGIAGKVRAGSILAAVRSATPGLPNEESGVPPFSSGPYAFVHNGAIEQFRQKAMRPLRESLTEESYSAISGATDSETVFTILLDRLREAPGDLEGALAETIRHVSGTCARLGVEATLNLAVTDGGSMAFSRYSTAGPGNSLYFLEDGERFPGAVVVVSEKLDADDGWRAVPDRRLLSVSPGSGVSLSPL